MNWDELIWKIKYKLGQKHIMGLGLVMGVLIVYVWLHMVTRGYAGGGLLGSRVVTGGYRW